MRRGEIPLYSIEDLQSIRNGIADDLLAASRGLHTNFAFARHHYTPPADRGPQRVQVMVIGGTNCTAAVAKRNGNSVTIERMSSAPLPVMETKKTFLDLIDAYFEPGIPRLNINFAYPVKPLSREGRMDGVLLKGTKDHRFSGLVGEAVGATAERHLKEATGTDVAVSMANDTICLILAGLGSWERQSLAGGVVGTGCNFGFFLDEGTVVNIESGNFDRFNQTETGKQIDSASADSGSQRLEKEISGAFLYRHYNLYAKQFGFDRDEIASTRELSLIAESEGTEALCARRLYERSASLVAALIAGIFDFKGREEMTFLIEGSLYWNGWNYTGFVSRYLQDMGIREGAVNVQCIEHSSVIGAAMLW